MDGLFVGLKVGVCVNDVGVCDGLFVGIWVVVSDSVCVGNEWFIVGYNVGFVVGGIGL